MMASDVSGRIDMRNINTPHRIFAERCDEECSNAKITAMAMYLTMQVNIDPHLWWILLGSRGG